MDSVKKFLMYIILIILLYIFVSVCSYAFIVKAYKNVNDYEILTTKPSIEILESKATYVNGYVVARVTNNTGIDTEKSYLKIDFYTERDNYLGTKYAEIGELKKDQTYEVRTSFKFNGVDNYKVSVTNSVAGSTINDENDSLADAVMPLIGIAAVIMFFYYIF